ncbi:MAG TPA: acyl-CoA dehydrogenase C-terminal domain-containing protein [Alcanivoracaceae bacterium]|nr:acyl-CoA dehydrogenase C-terminal domain-containing protein [Alcanivoracaceae bacterium]
MINYKVPLRDMRFLINEVFDYDKHYQKLPNGADATPDMVEAIITECARLCENTIAPLYQKGDEEGCHLEDGKVTTPTGYKEAYQELINGGWQGLSHPEEYGGQGLPVSLGMFKQEMMGAADWAFSMYPGLSTGAMNTILMHGTDEQKETYLTRLTSGEWTGTMCLTEPQCGTDLGQVKTRAIPQEDGTYKITGTKIFISAGEHDLTENIVHIVLARLPDAPKGTRGISLFIVPKHLPEKIGEDNGVSCGSLEVKMGIKGSATCVMNFDDATGFLIGPENKGLECMFTFMNSARIGTAMQGVCHAELSFQGALAYAKERRSMRALRGKQDPDEIADSIIHHADVRRMLLTQKAVAEGGRAMLYYTAQYADKMVTGMMEGDEEKRKYWDDQLGFLTPILKGFLTELGLESANLGMQVFGGHGYITEHGMEQIARDARISTLYEGTTGIQALDLLGRKVLLMTRGKCVRDFSQKMIDFGTRNMTNPTIRPFAWQLLKIAAQWNYLTTRLMITASRNREMVSSASHDYLMYSGYALMAYFWAIMAAKAQEKLDKGDGEQQAEFYQAKIATAEFYYDRLLPRAKGHAEAMLKPTKSLLQIKPEEFSFDYE